MYIEDEARLDLFSTGTNTHFISVIYKTLGVGVLCACVYDCVHVQLFWGGGVSCVLFNMLSFLFYFIFFWKS